MSKPRLSLAPGEQGKSPIRVLIVDDSAVIRQLLTRRLSADPRIEVVATAADAFAARDKIVRFRPDVVTLDIQMPRMDGLTFLGQLMKHYPIPVIVVSALTAEGAHVAVEAMARGAVDVLSKPDADLSVDTLAEDLIARIKSAHHGHVVEQRQEPVEPIAAPPSERCRNIFALGASTGGVAALHEILASFPADAPGTLVVQHMPAGFVESFTRRLGMHCRMNVVVAQEGDRIEQGKVLVAPGDRHMVVRRRGRDKVIALLDGPRVCHQRPSVEVLFDSLAECAGPETVAALLTGMGADGASGLLRLRRSGARTIAQNESTCAVFGMPREAIDLGAAEHVAPLQEISQLMFRLAESAKQSRGA